jgi:hypothetical protein
VRLLCRPHRWLLPAALLALPFVAWHVLPVVAAGDPRPWPDGAVRFYDATGTARTVPRAAARWNASGARVTLVEVDSRAAADVVFEVDDRRLRDVCGRDCLGYSSSIGRPRDGPAHVLLAASLGHDPRPLSVWVTAHEFGHVLGLEHHGGRACSVMSEHAFDTRCAPSAAAGQASMDQLACVPAPADVKNAARMYGGKPRRIDPSCR